MGSKRLQDLKVEKGLQQHQMKPPQLLPRRGPQIKKGPLDFLFSKEPEESIKLGKTMRQISVNESYNKASRDRAVQYIARFFSRNGIAFNVAK